jgi:LacI family transcriptional regulator
MQPEKITFLLQRICVHKMSVENTTHPTIIDVARVAGVSPATASRALANYGRVAAATIVRVKQAAEEIGYRPNELARSMRSGSTRTIGLVIISDFTNAFFDRATKAIVDTARSRGYQVLISHTDEDIDVERRAVRTLLDKQVDGLIIVPSLARDHSHLSSNSLGGKPVVLIDRLAQEIDATSVTTNDFSGARAAVRHAVSLGHKRLGFLISAFGVEGFTSARPELMLTVVSDRAAGFAHGSEVSGIPPHQQQWVYSQDLPVVSESAVAYLLDQPQPPTIIFTSNNDMALAVLTVAGNRGLRIGHDLSLVTVDDSQWAAAMRPGITVIARPVEHLGRLAVEHLVARIDTPTIAREAIVLPTELLERDSVANLKAGAPPH